MIILVVHSTGAFLCQVEIAIPLRLWLGLRGVAEQIERCGCFTVCLWLLLRWLRPLVNINAQTSIDRRGLHLVIPCTGCVVKIAIVHQRLDFDSHCSSHGPQQIVTNESGIGAVLHPEALLDQCVGARESPHRRRAFQAESLDEPETMW